MSVHFPFQTSEGRRIAVATAMLDDGRTMIRDSDGRLWVNSRTRPSPFEPHVGHDDGADFGDAGK
jgi:hypothetical protein